MITIAISFGSNPRLTGLQAPIQPDICLLAGPFGVMQHFQPNNHSFALTFICLWYYKCTMAPNRLETIATARQAEKYGPDQKQNQPKFLI